MSLPAPAAYAPPPPPERRPTRWWLVAIVAAWALVLAGLAVWSVRNDPPTVPEQRDLGQALPVLHRTAGAVVAAADGPDRVIAIGAVTLDRACALTPVRDGVEAAQEVTVRVRPDEAFGVLDSIARALPRAYRPAIRHNVEDTRQVLRADAGEFVGVEAEVDAAATSFALRISTGCRPGSAPEEPPGPVAQPPAAFVAASRALGGSGTATGVSVTCPDGRTATTATAGDLAAPKDLGRALRDVVAGALVIQAEPHAWAYRAGEVSVLVSDGDGTARVSATTSCR
ncbi:hypothetical protein COUCH_03270 [Couchioplanes caeruleus]|uniref:hypothetical protein n=1 Tax=Couchioplanes caeruleus TaxID=56438 RepID=UPI0020BDB149|nr:hypothetical protein [Couchioplanes caeruleus]UQU65372.1 hypothetical protein COUCH_03270 [Couchioplanes caeruleus]